MPEYIIRINLSALEKIKTEPFRRYQLLENSNYLRSLLKSEGFITAGESQIVPIILGDVLSTLKVSDYLKKQGYWVTAVRPPTVPTGQTRIRISLSSSHRKEDIERFVKLLIEANKDE